MEDYSIQLYFNGPILCKKSLPPINEYTEEIEIEL